MGCSGGVSTPQLALAQLSTPKVSGLKSGSHNDSLVTIDKTGQITASCTIADNEFLMSHGGDLVNPQLRCYFDSEISLY